MFVKKICVLITLSSLLIACGSGGGSSATTSSIASSKPASSSISVSSSNKSSTAQSSAPTQSSSSAAFAYCTDLLSDPDGDGFGLENNQTCTTRTAFSITDEMGVGWNLGNTLDAFGGETNWGNPLTTKAMIDTVKNAGFNTLRIPVTWDDFLSGSEYTIAKERMDRVEEVVNYGLSNNMIVIVNIHHNSGWVAPSTANETNATDHAVKIWKQISARFKDYDHRVVFETLNEPRVGEDWWGVQEYFTVLNRINMEILKEIRASGGKNSRRLVMIPGYVAGANDHQINAISVPNDKMIAISTHAYFPFNFALEQTGTALFTNTKDIDDVFNRLRNKFILNNIPVVMGEWASTDKSNLGERVRHAEYYVRAGKNARIPTVWWDNGNTNLNSSDVMGLLDRRNLTWVHPEILAAIINGAK